MLKEPPWQTRQWTKQDYELLLQFLRSEVDEKYRRFNEKLIPGAENQTLGVRIPILRKISQEIARGEYWRNYLGLSKGRLHEELMLEGMVIGEAKMTHEERVNWIRYFAPKINNWAICDSFVNQKMIKGKQIEFWPEVERYLASGDPWLQRLAYNFLMTYYLSDEEIDKCLAAVKEINSEHYYVQMMQAWLLATAFVKQRDKTWNFLEQHKTHLGDTVIKMTVQKIRDSYRISPEDKNLVLSLKK